MTFLTTSRTRWSARLLALLGILQGTGIINLSEEALAALFAVLVGAMGEFLRSAVDRVRTEPEAKP